MYRAAKRSVRSKLMRSFLLRSKDVAHILDCSPDALYPLIQRGELPAIRKGRLWRFRLQDVQEYLKRKARRQRWAYHIKHA
jgi:excisionase family DNA binding protein